MATKNVQTFDVSNFDALVLKSQRPVLVDFWAEWCGPCRFLEPILERLADRLEGQVQFGKVDVDANPSLAEEFGILGIPTLAVFKDGAVVDRVVGAAPEGRLVSVLERHLDAPERVEPTSA